MDVNLTNASFVTQNQNVRAAYAAYSNANQNSAAEKATVGNAYEVDISDAAKQAQQAAKTAVTTEEEQPAEVQTKGVSADVVEELKENIKVNEQAMLNVMIQALTDSNNTLQNWLSSGTGILNFGGVQVDASRFGLPEVATNPADAAKAVADGGAWSVDSVATRIFDLANTLAGGDPDKLEEMRGAVEEGFRQAGVAWQGMTGSSSMPDITSQTYNELMHRFDVRMQELAVAGATVA